MNESESLFVLLKCFNDFEYSETLMDVVEF